MGHRYAPGPGDEPMIVITKLTPARCRRAHGAIRSSACSARGAIHCGSSSRARAGTATSCRCDSARAVYLLSHPDDVTLVFQDPRDHVYGKSAPAARIRPLLAKASPRSTANAGAVASTGTDAARLSAEEVGFCQPSWLGPSQSAGPLGGASRHAARPWGRLPRDAGVPDHHRPDVRGGRPHEPGSSARRWTWRWRTLDRACGARSAGSRRSDTGSAAGPRCPADGTTASSGELVEQASRGKTRPETLLAVLLDSRDAGPGGEWVTRSFATS